MDRDYTTLPSDDLLGILRTSTSDDHLDNAAYQLSIRVDRRATTFLIDRLRQEHEPWLRERLVGALIIGKDPATLAPLLEIFQSAAEADSVKSLAALGLGWLRL